MTTESTGVPVAVHATWGWVVDITPYRITPELWQRAHQMVQAGILLGFDTLPPALTFPERLSNRYFLGLLVWVTRGTGPRPELPDGFNDDFVSPFREESETYSPPGPLLTVTIEHHHRSEQALVRATALQALGIVFNVQPDHWSYDIPNSPLTLEGALAVRKWVRDGGSRPNFAAMCYSR